MDGALVLGVLGLDRVEFNVGLQKVLERVGVVDVEEAELDNAQLENLVSCVEVNSKLITYARFGLSIENLLNFSAVLAGKVLALRLGPFRHASAKNVASNTGLEGPAQKGVTRAGVALVDLDQAVLVARVRDVIGRGVIVPVGMFTIEEVHLGLSGAWSVHNLSKRATPDKSLNVNHGGVGCKVDELDNAVRFDCIALVDTRYFFHV